MKLKASLVLAFGLMAGTAFSATELVVATVNNGHMIEMQKLTKHFESANPDIKVKWVTLEEGVLRQRVTHFSLISGFAASKCLPSFCISIM